MVRAWVTWVRRAPSAPIALALGGLGCFLLVMQLLVAAAMALAG